MKKKIVRRMDNVGFTLKRRLRFRIRDKITAGELVISNLRKVTTRAKADAWACSWSLSETDAKPRDIYGEDVEIRFIRYLRAEREFDSLDSLAQQIDADVRLARELCVA